jgi:hypothetical protein
MRGRGTPRRAATAPSPWYGIGCACTDASLARPHLSSQTHVSTTTRTKPAGGSRILSRTGAPADIRLASAVDATSPHRFALGAGVPLILAALLTNVMLWWSPRFGMPEWEFTTVSQSIDGMPLMLIGITLVAVGALGSGRVWAVRAVAVVCGLLALLLLGMSALYSLAGMVAWNVAQAAPAAAQALLTRAVAKTLLLSAMYILVFGGFAITLVRRSRGTR